LADNSAIEWTNATWNPVTGCDKVSPGCAHCYAETFAERWRDIPGHPYQQGFDCQWPSVSPRGRSSDFPSGGHLFSLLVAIGSPRVVAVCRC
jgi:protein gp37